MDLDAAARSQRKAAKQRKRKLFLDKNGRPELKNCFVLYVDQIGTKQRLASYDDATLRRDITLLASLRTFLHDQSLETDTQRMTAFTDNIVLGVPFNSYFDDLGLAPVVFSAAWYQLASVQNGNLLRGGLAAGKHYMDKSLVTGPTLVEAVLLEEQVAVYPRIVLSRDMIGFVFKDELATGYANRDDDSPWNSYLALDGDGELFINYLSGAFEPFGEWGPAEAALKAHRHAVKAGLRLALPERAHDKWVWAAHYHNWFCTRYELPGSLQIRKRLQPYERMFPRQFEVFLSGGLSELFDEERNRAFAAPNTSHSSAPPYA